MDFDALGGASSANGGWGGLPEGVPKVRGESDLNALRMFILLEERFGSEASIPTNIARRVTGLPRRSFYRYLTLLERASLLEWRRGSMDFRSKRRVEGSVKLQSLSQVDRARALRLATRAKNALQEQREYD